MNIYKFFLYYRMKKNGLDVPLKDGAKWQGIGNRVASDKQIEPGYILLICHNLPFRIHIY